MQASVDEDAYLDALMAFAAQGLPALGLGAGLEPLVDAPKGGTDAGASSSHSRPNGGQSAKELARQEKARVKYRRIYHMRQARRQTLRAHVAALESELAALATRHGRADAVHSPLASPPGPDQLEQLLSGRRPVTTSRERSHALRELAGLQLQLKRENAEMRRRLHGYSASAELVRDELLAEHKLWVATATSFTMLKRLTVPESLAIHSRGLATVDGVLASRDALTSAGIVCGWKEARRVDRGLVRFVLQKTFFRYTAEDVAGRMFAIMSDPRQIAKLYRSSMDASFHFVQRVSDDCVMLLMEMAALPGLAGAKISTIPLVSRRKTRAGYQILVQPLVANGFPMRNDVPMDSAPVGVVAADAAAGLNDHCFGILIEEAGAGADCHVTFVGVAQAVESHTFFWVIEELLHCVRAEELMFGPRFSLPRAATAHPGLTV